MLLSRLPGPQWPEAQPEQRVKQESGIPPVLNQVQIIPFERGEV